MISHGKNDGKEITKSSRNEFIQAVPSTHCRNYCTFVYCHLPYSTTLILLCSMLMK